jgi:hypothetical protein
LSESATARLLSALLDQALIPAELQVDLLEKAGGNPLYADEYVRMLVDRGFLHRTGRTWRRDAGQVPLPETVQGIIAARLDALDPGEKALLADAAVLGTVSWLGALAKLGGTQPLSLQSRLRVLEDRQFLREERHSSVAGERQFSFRHVLVRDVAYAQLPRGQRADKHQKAAEWIEALSPDRAEDRAELLAHHYLAAVAYARAARQDTAVLAERTKVACGNAGDRALELNAFSAAKRWYAAALDHLDHDDPARPRLLFRLGRARFYAEQAGGEQLAEARDGLLAAGDRESAAEAEAMLGKLAWLAGEGARAIEHDRRAAALLAGAPPSRAKATVLVELAGVLMVAGRNQEAIEVGREGLAIAERLRLDDIRADALNHVGAAMVSTGDPAGFVDMEQAVALAVAANSPLCVIAYVNLGSTLVECGELRRGFELQAEGRRAAERFGFTAWQRHLRAERVLEDYWGGRWDASEKAAAEFVAESEAGSRHYMEPVCRLVQGRIRLALGHFSAAAEDAKTVLESARLIEDPQMLNPALAFAAAVALRTGNSKAAEALANELLASLAEHDGALVGADWPVDLAIVLVALGRGNELAELAATSRLSNLWLEAATAFATGDPQDRLAHVGIDRHAEREPHALIAQVPGELGARPGAVAADQDRQVPGGPGELGQGQVDQGDQVISAARWGVAWPQDPSKRLTRRLAAVQVGQQWMEPERMLVGACRAFLGITVGQDQGRVGVHDQHLDSWIATASPGAGAGMGPGGTQPGQPVRVAGDPFQHPPGGRGGGHRAEQLRLVAESGQVRKAVPAVGQHHRQIPQHRRIRMAATAAGLVPAQRPGQPNPVGQLPQQRRAGMADHPGSVGSDFEAGRPVGSLHPQGALLEPGLRPSDSRILPA